MKGVSMLRLKDKWWKPDADKLSADQRVPGGDFLKAPEIPRYWQNSISV
jgi:hypothetical protein